MRQEGKWHRFRKLARWASAEEQRFTHSPSPSLYITLFVQVGVGCHLYPELFHITAQRREMELTRNLPNFLYVIGNHQHCKDFLYKFTLLDPKQLRLFELPPRTPKGWLLGELWGRNACPSSSSTGTGTMSAHDHGPSTGHSQTRSPLWRRARRALRPFAFIGEGLLAAWTKCSWPSPTGLLGRD